jgi:SAM-dependent methyltransferase
MSKANAEQIDYWNGRAGAKWVAMQANLDAMLAPATTELKTRAGSVSQLRVLDIGCGTGETCAIWLDGGAQVTGVDVSAPMLARAAERTQGKARLLEADASQWVSDSPFDLVVSRFGVMFFAAPDQAFATIFANVRPRGRLLFTCWRQAVDNQWVSTPLSAIRSLLPEAPPPPPHAPGPFAFADKDRLARILMRAGFSDIVIQPKDVPICLASEGGVAAAVRFAMQVGPSGAALAEASDDAKAIAAERLKTVLEPFDKGGVVTLGGAIWVVEARRSGPI